VLYLLYHSSQVPRQNSFGQDTARISDAALDDLLKRGWEASDRAAGFAAYRKAQTHLVVLVAGIPLHESHHFFAHHHGLGGIAYDNTHRTPLFVSACITLNLRHGHSIRLSAIRWNQSASFRTVWIAYREMPSQSVGR